MSFFFFFWADNDNFIENKTTKKQRANQEEPIHLYSQQGPKKEQKRWDEVSKPNKKKPSGLTCELID
jgi:hypothetical protein